MNEYEQLIEKGQLALNNGEYKICVDLLNPFLESFHVSSEEGINIRMMLITALSGLNEKEESIKICKQLIKSQYSHIREEAKSLIQILNSPNLEIPDNWNIKFEDSLIPQDYNPIIPKNINSSKPRKYINVTNLPTGQTKPFQKGFIVITTCLLILILSLLSGCVKVENTLDLRDIDAIKFELRIDNKYISKLPWQLNFEHKLRDIFSSKDITFNDENFILNKKDINIKQTNLYINKILKTVSDSLEIGLNDIKINQLEKNYLFGKKYFYKINLDLMNFEKFDDLEIFLKIINPSKVTLLTENKNISSIDKNIIWKIIPGDINQIEFFFWDWNRLLISTIFAFLLVFAAYLIRNKRYELGSNLPQLPS
tara:strand:+ start:982 stop:2085 length:1104 start_codon:yes stop_codon:yes gene_type:complete